MISSKGINEEPHSRVLEIDPRKGVNYVCDASGTILAVGKLHWDAFAFANGAHELTATRMLGRNLFDCMSGDDVKQTFRGLIQTAVTNDKSIWFDFRCDAPDARRDMRMRLSSLNMSKGASAVHFQCFLVREQHRAPLALFENLKIRGRAVTESTPIALMCSCCHKIADHAPEARDLWVEVEVFCKSSRSNAYVVHSICPTCLGRFHISEPESEPLEISGDTSADDQGTS